jgi:hypothetical protein
MALGAVAVCCRFRYEQLELPSSGDGGVTTNGGATASGAGGVQGVLGGAPGPVDGGAGNGNDSGAGASPALGGMAGTESGSGGSSTTGGSSAGAGGEPSLCVTDDTCGCDVFQGHEYRFCAVLTTRGPGLLACQSANMVLTRVDSAEENAWLLQQFIDRGMFLGTGDPVVLLDGNDIAVEGQWRWEDGTLFWEGGAVGDVYTNWAFPPKTSQGDCVSMMSSGLWEDRSCSSGNATVSCESP